MLVLKQSTLQAAVIRAFGRLPAKRAVVEIGATRAPEGL